WSITVGAAGSGTDTKVTNPSLSDVLVAKAATSTFGGAAGSCTGDVKRSGGNGGAAGAAGGGGNAAGSTTGGAAAAGKVVVFYLTVDTPTLLGGYRPIEVIGMNTNPTPGGVLFHRVKGVADAPPPIAGIGPPNRWRVETPSPPPFPGQVLAFVGQDGPTPLAGRSSVIPPVAVNAEPFPGAVIRAKATEF